MSAEMVTAICVGISTILTSIVTIIIKLNRIHVLVNSRLTEALDQITYLKTKVDILESRK